ncbi:hypothetical protein [Microbacterium sp. GXS0129]|uniref:hypothetical protein n=1 Tax=Microbacterium sp. GXS0129 TaxID=3377836 RepID=UPI00383B6B53
MTDEAAEDERRRLLAAAYGRAGAGLEPAEAQRLAELMAPVTELPHDRSVDAPEPSPSTHARRPGQQADASTARRRPRTLMAVGALVVLLATFAAGWAANNGLQTREDAVTQITVDESIAATLNAARVEVARAADPDTLLYIGTLFGGVVWEARSADGETRCFVIAAIPDGSQPSSADVLGCVAETAGAAELGTTSKSGESYTARGTIQAVWQEGRPAQLEPDWQDVTMTALETNAIVERTRAAARGDGSGSAIPVAISGLTALWAVERDGLHCVSAITLSGSDVNTAGYESAESCRDDFVYGETQTWTFPGPEFSFPAESSGRYIRTVITWPPGEGPVATLREQ